MDKKNALLDLAFRPTLICVLIKMLCSECGSRQEAYFNRYEGKYPSETYSVLAVSGGNTKNVRM